MLAPEVRPSLRMVQQVAMIERFCGAWDRLSQSSVLASEYLAHFAAMQGACSMVGLDQTSSPRAMHTAGDLLKSLRIDVLKSRNGGGAASLLDAVPAGSQSEPLRSLLAAHDIEFEMTANDIQQLYACLTGQNTVLDGESFCRRGALRFQTPDNRLVFPTVSGFLVEQRLAELAAWTQDELDADRYHPLLIIGVFHLLFLQICPFPTANHLTSLTIVWHLLRSSGYGFVCYRHFAPILAESPEQYFSALRQAEKTAGENWATLNVWLEYFLDCLCRCCRELSRTSERTSKASRLSAVQRDIIDVIRETGSATREVIVSRTGINLSTVKYNLSVLSANGHLKRHGGGRTTSYSLL